MLYTVKEVSSLSGVTIKALHHYHKIGLLPPREISDAGYRLYGAEELKRLQHILFYRELDFSLEKIKRLLDGEPDRPALLSQQQRLLLARKARLDAVIQTLTKSMESMEKGEEMDKRDMFRGFENEEQWNDAMSEHNVYLKETYGAEVPKVAAAEVANMNEQAEEAAAFMGGMAEALRTGLKRDDGKVRRLIRDHISFMNERGRQVSAADFADQTRFFLGDDFHLRMLEDQQTGLAYFLAAAAESFAADPGRAG
ncbi:MerR family transcriptional regulator [Cohnella massiliensis]|uniref:MerR family transcriptional regulator n=1 Tax=Cohnella massiliensis TaxID=1816691 RepID=UPI0009BA7DD0|nr:MerR family transcriptional regulator [Cohnella massiliensis]